MSKAELTLGDFDVNSTIYSNQNLIQQWGLTFSKCDRLILQLDDKEIWENVNGSTSAAGQVYVQFNNYTCHIVNRHRVVLSDACSRLDEIEGEAILSNEISTKTKAGVIAMCAEVAQDVKSGWGNMMACIEAVHGVYGQDPRSTYGGPLSLKQLEAHQFCSNAIEDVLADCAMRYNCCFNKMGV